LTPTFLPLFFSYNGCISSGQNSQVPNWQSLIAGLLALAIALITAGTQAYIAAVINPVKSLKTE